MKAKEAVDGAFAVVYDGREITVIVEESRVDEVNAFDVQRGYRLLTFDGVLPFDLVGFIARVSTALAEEGVSIFVVSSYSTDHIFVKESDLDRAIKGLRKAGFEVVVDS
ncbi:ACT domain-containing protein [Archaeoglobus veneficus]|uniref:CASTOR ACT domain-containing protein n=1 Tax=Archaeoglobus veneficus (strain DSM 11195 / SNP6) TaxID=693661 RepID=F2KMV3_ARCVS|nr:ACT domain-containing protein [Archaeoglobus veneficus]AEA46127.1 hypothetical protein Arcve_0086 [Archaeoglobus veneficus SNP6]